jgi:hypothetical protein
MCTTSGGSRANGAVDSDFFIVPSTASLPTTRMVDLNRSIAAAIVKERRPDAS